MLNYVSKKADTTDGRNVYLTLGIKL
jgi:hypothetical protein